MRAMSGILLSLGGVLLLGQAAWAQEDGVRAVVEKAIRAHGGEARVERARARQTRNKGVFTVDGQKVPFTQEVSYEWPNKFKGVLEVQTAAGAATAVTVFNGTQAWRQIQGQTTELDGKALDEVKEETYATQLVHVTNLLSRDLQIRPAAEASVGGRPAVGVKVACRGHRDVTLYFDKETGLLAEAQRQALDVKTGKEFSEEKVFSDYQLVDGLPYPRRVTVYRDGKKFIDAETVSIRYLDRLDASVFAKP